MNAGIQSQRSSFDDWWKSSRSLVEIAELLERTFEIQQAMDRRLVEILQENKTLHRRCAEAKAQHAGERSRLEAEIANLQLQANEMLRRLEEKAKTGRWTEAEQPAKERLLNDELERKIQALQLELKNERIQHAKRVEQMEAQLARCICGDVKIDYAEPSSSSNSQQTRERWKIRNSR